MKRLYFSALLPLLSLSPSLRAATGGASALEFNRDVRPILAENCYACHGFDPKHREAGLRLDTFDGATEDRKGVRGIVPGDLAKSEVWLRVISEDKDEIMPPPKAHKPPLTDEQRSVLRRWITEGARYEKHWAFVPPKMAAESAGQPNAIDLFVTKRLAEEGLTASPEADPTTLMRRVCLDLTGLPPSESEVAAFLKQWKSDRSAAYAALVDRLLESPHYGERWGRWWLDQARYADSNGYSIDAPRQIWKFRDWVVQALNEDKPFDQFTIEQLAGDLLPSATESQKIATGFHRNTQINQEGGIDKEQFRIDSIFDRVATTGSVWLGLTVGCAQCHDHKFDPIEQKEYYRLFAFLNNQDEPTMKVFDEGQDVAGMTAELGELKKQLQSYMDAHRAELAEWEAGITPAIKKSLNRTVVKLLGKPVKTRTFTELQTLFAAGIGGVGPFRELNDRYKELDTLLNQGVTTLVLSELPKPRKTTVFIKGDFTRPDEEVTPGTPAVLHPLKGTNALPTRLDLAHWIMSQENPLTARVIMNRVWQQYFGRGIVETENDFGQQGTSPSHPELLDWLALTFQQRKWSLKEMHKLIVSSKTYRQSSGLTPLLAERDPRNYLLARQQRLRLDAEVVRDVALAASGLLSPKVGGPPVYPPIPDGVMGQGQVKRVWSVSKGEDKYRRGLYTFVYRGSPPPSLTVFDAPDGFNTCTRRLRSNTPLQALTLMNDAAFHEFALALEKIVKQQGMEAAFRRCTGRSPSNDELNLLARLDPLNAARALLNMDETVTRE